MAGILSKAETANYCSSGSRNLAAAQMCSTVPPFGIDGVVGAFVADAADALQTAALGFPDLFVEAVAVMVQWRIYLRRVFYGCLKGDSITE